ncbi:uncharacterized protein LOC112493782 [Cephus cinctus]|uniref:Uncharacterized protein LOC112493782 n=1 Tax=Cephus cinctus TaxID=211228 RepID=A0AAJ7VXC9_CEPCN|nr:uncharacterized protein LOC112493782 [Cephus cinctus]
MLRFGNEFLSINQLPRLSLFRIVGAARPCITAWIHVDVTAQDFRAQFYQLVEEEIYQQFAWVPYAQDMDFEIYSTEYSCHTLFLISSCERILYGSLKYLEVGTRNKVSEYIVTKRNLSV